MSELVITYDDIAALAERRKIKAPLLIVDGTFLMPRLDWITGPFADAVTALVKRLDFTYVPESRDCDDFARFVCWYMSYLQGRMGKGNGKAIAAGEFGYYDDTIDMFGGYHAIVAAVSRRAASDPIDFFFFEPQPVLDGMKITKVCMTEKKLSDDAVASCIYFRL